MEMEFEQEIASAALEVVTLLVQNGLTITTAESCTGGMVAEALTSVDGASKAFLGGIVAYANEVKTAQLDVRKETLADFGAVSHQTCLEMAEGVLKKMHADMGISTTGIAGPTGGTPEKPVGTVYIGVSIFVNSWVKKLDFVGTRVQIRQNTTLQILKLVKEVIDNTRLNDI